MKKITYYFLLSTSIFLLTATQCEDDDPDFSCENQLESLSELGIVIEDLVNSSICDEAFECRYIAFGSKPCGGPWRYLTFSTSIDTIQLRDLVEEYNAIEESYNMNCDAVSDCAFAIPPSGLACESNQCIPLE